VALPGSMKPAGRKLSIDILGKGEVPRRSHRAVVFRAISVQRWILIYAKGGR